MTFWDDEKSLASGVPYELHEFRLGETSTYWRYADAPADVSYGGNTYTALYITGGEIESGVNALKSRTVVKCNWNNPFAWQYTIAPPNDIINYKRYKAHGANTQLIFTGEVISVIFKQSDRKGKRHAEIIIEPPRASLGRMGLISRYSRQCTVELYCSQCGVSRASYKQSGTLDSVSGNVLTSTTFGGEANGYWLGGDIVVNSRRSKIIAHSGNNVTILPFIYGLSAGNSFDVYPGCDHLIATCNSKFNNRNNIKAQPNIPFENPFGSEGMF